MNDELVPKPEFKVDKNKKYKVEELQDSVVYTDAYQEKLLGLYYLVS